MGLLIFDRCILQTFSDEAGGDEVHQAELAILTLSSPKGPKSGQVVKFVAKRELIAPSSGSVDVGFRWPGCVQLHSDDI